MPANALVSDPGISIYSLYNIFTMESKDAGFEEIPHTADWAIHVWAKDLPGLFEQSVLGINSMAGAVHSAREEIRRSYRLEGQDNESLLIGFLSEILYAMEHERLMFVGVNIELEGTKLKADMIGWKIESIRKAIKAVTFHNIKIRHEERGSQVDIVFDV